MLALVLIAQKVSLATVFTIRIAVEATQEVPPNPSTAVGALNGTYDDVTRVLDFDLIFTGLLSPTTAAHFHAPAPEGVIGPIVINLVPDGFPLGVTSGAFARSYVLTVAQGIQIVGGLFYVNIHTAAFPGGEIRGQLTEGTLPVELSSFVSTINNNNVSLNWSTTTEINNSGFEVERSVSNGTWSKIGFVQGNGNSNLQQNYEFTDRGLNKGTYNYRLKQIDFNGNFEYFMLTNEVTVGIPASFSLSQNYPNPFNPTTNIDYALPFDGKVSISLYDMSGKEVETLLNENKSAGYYSIQFNGSALSSGIYFYTITSTGNGQNFVSTKKMMLVK